mmetsp:Transcript_116472/g.213401  ORF Transcript_116472/g.213401 Transcript_116472/m.213401 type:complete len:83 (-) Transcript_116472:33-281(-)
MRGVIPLAYHPVVCHPFADHPVACRPGACHPDDLDSANDLYDSRNGCGGLLDFLSGSMNGFCDSVNGSCGSNAATAFAMILI